MGKFYVINAPFLFSTVWSIIKVFAELLRLKVMSLISYQGWLDPVTQAKIQILGKNYLPELTAQIPAENLPTDLGGTSQDDFFSDAGPWHAISPEQIQAYKAQAVAPSTAAAQQQSAIGSAPAQPSAASGVPTLTSASETAPTAPVPVENKLTHA